MTTKPLGRAFCVCFESKRLSWVFTLTASARLTFPERSPWMRRALAVIQTSARCFLPSPMAPFPLPSRGLTCLPRVCVKYNKVCRLSIFPFFYPKGDFFHFRSKKWW